MQSVIILTRLPFISLFSEICSIIAPEYFESGLKSIEAACHEINRWQPPVPGDTLKLGLFGTVIQVRCQPNSLNCFRCSKVDFIKLISLCRVKYLVNL